ncbi:MAG: hypothetical protein J3K34DRAFT_116883 [Monoraphidium minutum]|nr:MAG: hypothetical protein J3K34DRAFT_116883 [Monoraphidium minutum]
MHACTSPALEPRPYAPPAPTNVSFAARAARAHRRPARAPPHGRAFRAAAPATGPCCARPWPCPSAWPRPPVTMHQAPDAGAPAAPPGRCISVSGPPPLLVHPAAHSSWVDRLGWVNRPRLPHPHFLPSRADNSYPPYTRQRFFCTSTPVPRPLRRRFARHMQPVRGSLHSLDCAAAGQATPLTGVAQLTGARPLSGRAAPPACADARRSCCRRGAGRRGGVGATTRVTHTLMQGAGGEGQGVN